MKKVYNNPVVNVLTVNEEDIITTSLTNGGVGFYKDGADDGDMVAKMTDFTF